MAGSASNWFKASAGPLKGQAVYFSKAQRQQLGGGIAQALTNPTSLAFKLANTVRPAKTALRAVRNLDWAQVAAKTKGIDIFSRDALKAFTRRFDSWAVRRSPPERAALTMWAGITGKGRYLLLQRVARGAGSMADDIMQDLRGQDIPTAAVIRSLNAALRASRLPNDLVTYRGTSLAEVRDWKVGEQRQTVGFMATSVDREWAATFAGKVKLQIRAPKGSRAGLVDSIVPKHNEAEILFPQQTRFTVTRITEMPNGTREVEIEINPD